MFDPAVMRREIEIIKNDLCCNTIRITGRDLERLVMASEYALDLGLEVWFGPACTTRPNSRRYHTLLAARPLRKLSGRSLLKLFSSPDGS